MERRLFKTLPLAIAILAVGFSIPDRANAQLADAGAEEARPTAQDSLVARIIATLMPRNHISTESLNDTISQRALDLFIASLDPLKLYFYQSDIDEFKKYENNIDDSLSGSMNEYQPPKSCWMEISTFI